MSKDDVSFTRGLPLYITGFACIASGLFSLSTYSGVLGVLTGILAFIAAGFILYFGWLMQMGMDTKDTAEDAFILIDLLHNSVLTD